MKQRKSLLYFLLAEMKKEKNRSRIYSSVQCKLFPTVGIFFSRSNSFIQGNILRTQSKISQECRIFPLANTDILENILSREQNILPTLETV
jgi:hypothetical protein